MSLFDHYRPPMGGPAGPCLDGPTALAALAALVPRVRCALLVSATAWRHPALAASAAMTIDRISGGRLEFGVGVGGDDLAFAQYGIARPGLAERFAQLDEACQVMRLLWDGGPVDFDGEHFTLRAAHVAPAPVQERLPLVVGGAGERGTLPLVARHADVWNCLALPLDRYRRAAGVLDEQCGVAGRDPGQVRRSVTFRAVVTTSAAEARAAREQVVADVAGRAPDLPEYISFGSAQECLDVAGAELAVVATRRARLAELEAQLGRLWHVGAVQPP